MGGALYTDRRDAGRALAGRLGAHAPDGAVVVLALPRGGVPVAWEVARTLGAPLDIMPVRKLGVPGFEELAMGAIAGTDTMVLNDDVTGEMRLPAEEIDRVAAREWAELRRRERVYRGDRPPADLAGATAILVDDGLATGVTMRAAAIAARAAGAARVVVAVPVAPAGTEAMLRREADEVVCAATPWPFQAVGQWYDDFSATTDDEVRALLGSPPVAGAPGA
ncbi:MAG: phosphoribosyltransferase [Thermoleophilia bacterium]